MWKQSKLAPGLLMTALSAAFALPAGAVPLTFEFGGVIDFVEDGLPISDQIAVGMPYTGIYQFDPEGIQDSDPHPSFGSYLFGDAGFMSVDIGSVNMATTDLLIFIENSIGLDLFKVSSASPFLTDSIMWRTMELDIRDATRTAFDSDALPLTAPDLDDFQFARRFAMRQVDHRFPSITGTVTYLNMIPEPSSLATLFTGAALLFLRRRHVDHST